MPGTDSIFRSKILTVMTGYLIYIAEHTLFILISLPLVHSRSVQPCCMLPAAVTTRSDNMWTLTSV